LSFFAMSLFFTLSGFVIHYNYGQSFATNGHGPATSRFLLARFARLYPLYFVGLILSVSIFPQGPFFTNPWVALSCLTLTQSWFNIHGAVGDLLGASWSISTEFGLYLMFIPLAAAISRLSHALIVLVCFCVLAVLVIVALVLAYPGYLSHILEPLHFIDPPESAPPWQWLLYASPPVRALEFFAGAIAAQFVLTRPPLLTKDNSAVSIVAIGCVVYCVVIIIFGPPVSIESTIGALMPDFIFAPAIVTLLILVSCRDIWLTRLMSSGPMIAAGTISYSVYLLQPLAFQAINNTFVGLHFFGNMARAVFAILIVTALAHCVYYLFEEPMRARIRSIGARRVVS